MRALFPKTPVAKNGHQTRSANVKDFRGVIGSLSTLQRAAADPQERLTQSAQCRSAAPGRLGTLRVRLVPSELRNLSFFMLGGLGALPSNMPRHAQLRCHSWARGVHRKVLCQNGLLRGGPLNPWHPGQFSWESSKIFSSTQTEQNLGRSAKPLVHSRHPFWHSPKFSADRCDSCFGFDFYDEVFIAFCSRYIGEAWCVC